MIDFLRWLIFTTTVITLTTGILWIVKLGTEKILSTIIRKEK